MIETDSESVASDDDDSSSSSCCSTASFDLEDMEDEAAEDQYEWSDLTKDPAALQALDSTTESASSTVLSTLLWDRAYEAVLDRIQSHPHEVSIEIELKKPCSSSSSSNYHDEDPGTTQTDVVDRGMPLLLAAAMRPLPPLSIFKALLDACPEAISQPDSTWNMLPLHFAVNLSTKNVDNDVDYWEDASPAHRAQVVELLLSAFPEAALAREDCFGRTPLHVAAATTIQSVDGMIPPTSHSVIQALLLHHYHHEHEHLSPHSETEEHEWEAIDHAGYSPRDLCQGPLKASLTVCFAGTHWKPNPLLLQQQLVAPPASTTTTSSTATSHSCCSSSSSTSISSFHPSSSNSLQQRAPSAAPSTTSTSFSSCCGDSVMGDTLFEEMSHVSEFESTCDDSEMATVFGDALEDDCDDDDDDATFVTAKSSEETVIPYPNLVSKQDEDVASVLTTYEEEACTTAAAVEPIRVESPAPFFTLKAESSHKKMHVQLQVHASDLIRPRKSTKAILFGMPLLPSKTINPFYKIELVEPDTNKSVVLHESEPYYGRRGALWEPVDFTVDEKLVQCLGLGLRISFFHRQSPDAASKKKHEDKWIGSQQASFWDLGESVDQMPIVGRDSRTTGQMRLVSYKTTVLGS